MSATLKLNRAAINRVFTRAINEGAYAMAQEGARAAEAVLSGSTGRHEGAPPGSYPNFQAGELAGSIRFVHPDQLGTPGRAAYGTKVPHGKYMEYGATVRPKNAKAIPVPCNIQAKVMLARIKGASLRTQNLKPLKAKNGWTYLTEVTPKGKPKKNGALFVLRKFVIIAARPWLRPSYEHSMGAMKAAFAATMEKELVFR